MTSNSISEVLEYLILKKMAGRPEVLKALLDYVDGNISPATASTVYGISKYQLRGFAQRIYDKAGNRSLASLLIKIAVPIILEKTKVYIDRSQKPEECLICNRKLYNVFPEDHIKKHHKDVITLEKQRIIVEIKKVLSKEFVKEEILREK
ncbi:MAG: hypothetical protein LM586_02050 [Desulfurococcales archaeon]|jgi:hypothetical protein|nr:hypothetical protein [Desulfurococcales archaeon]MCC6061574.1 hypothetical protein [Desulfurococcales archaeon]